MGVHDGHPVKVQKCSAKGSSINDVTAIGGGGVKDFVTTVLKLSNEKRNDRGGRGCQKNPNLYDVIYGRSLSKKKLGTT